ncbi:MAG: glycosyltransferase [Synechococcus sp.]
MLSLSMIVRNEAERLPQCLASVADFVDEMVVVDTGSQDDTVAVARSLGATVHAIAWPGDFAPARNQALALVRGDWVLVLDADEQLRAEARTPLGQLMADPDALVITLLRRELGAAQTPYSTVSRLFRRHPDLHWSRPYHSQIDDSVLALQAREPHWRIRHCPEPALLHDGYGAEALADGRKARQLRAAMQAELRQRPNDPYAIAKLAGLELRAGRRPRALALLRRGLGSCPEGAHAERFELLLALAIGLTPTDPGQAAACYREALQLPVDARILAAARLNLALLRQQQGDLGEAAALAQAVTDAAPELLQGWLALGQIERQRDRIPEAIAAHRQALARDSAHPEAHQNLAAALLMAGDITGARQGFRQAIALLRHQGRAEEAAALARRAGELVRLDP